MRARGFIGWAEGYIHDNPGLTAKEIAQRCLGLDIVDSSAQNPVASLAATLQKHYADQGRRINRIKERGIYRYYPASSRNGADSSPDNQHHVRGQHADHGQRAQHQDVANPSGPAPEERLTPERLQQYLDLADQLVEVGRFASQRDALVWVIGGNDSTQNRRRT